MLPRADETQPEIGRRRFMAILGLVLAAFSILIVLAGTAATITLQPCD
jgi:pantothenate kinase type III